MDIKLLPKEYISKSKVTSKGFRVPTIGDIDKSGASRIRINPNLTLGISVIFLIIIILIYVGVAIYNSSLMEKEEELVSQIEILEASRDLEAENSLRDLEKRIKNASRILEDHIYPSYLFRKIENLTMPQVQWTKFQADLPEQAISLGGKAINYTVLAKQLVIFEKDPQIDQVEVSGVSLIETGQAGFSLKLKFSSEFLRYERVR